MSNKLLLKGRRALNVVMTAVAAVAIGVAINFTALTSYAESAGTINATTSVNIRADASTTSDIVTTKAGGESIQILGQKTGADGNVWYQIYINATTVGYVRSDFATITDGSIPDTINADGTVSSIDESVTKVNPVSGEVTGGQAVRVRSDASTSATIVSSASSGQALTVNGTKVGTDEKTWYYVEFTDSSSNTVKGFIRSDFIELGGDLVEITEGGDDTAATTTDTDTTAAEDTAAVVEQKDYDTELQNGVWYLLDYKEGKQYSIESMFEIINNYQEDQNSKSKSGTAKTVWLIIFIVIAIAALGAAAYLFLKLREANDKEAFAEADKERKARLGADRKNQPATAQKNGQRPAQGTANGQRPAQGTANGQRPAQGTANGQRPAQGTANGQRTVQGTVNGQRPAQGTANGQRPVQSGAQRPVQSGVQRPVQSGVQRPVQSGVQRPVQSGAQRPVQSGNVNRTSVTQNTGKVSTATAQNSQAPKNGYDDDDDFEFGFLNWDDDKK